MKKYYAMERTGTTADITIYGDIVSWPWYEGDVSSYTLAKALERVEAEHINLYINSYGGEVAEGLAIYNALKRHPAQVTAYCDGFACSAASVVFMAGDERIMGAASLLMIHNAWTWAEGNADALRKQADDLDAISTAAANAYRAAVSIGEEELTALLRNEAWIPPEDAVRMGFATSVAVETPSGHVEKIHPISPQKEKQSFSCKNDCSAVQTLHISALKAGFRCIWAHLTQGLLVRVPEACENCMQSQLETLRLDF